MGITFTGLASGFNSQSVIDKLVAAEKIPEQAIQGRLQDTNSQISIVGDLTSKLQALQTQAQGLNLPSLVTSLTGTSTDETKVKATTDSSAAPGTYDLVVSHLATVQTSKSIQFASDAAGIAGTGSLQISVAGGAGQTINYGPNDKLEDIASKINSLGTAVTASVLFDGSKYQIMISGRNTGAANSIGFVDGGQGLGYSNPGATIVAAQDAAFTVNGIPITRSSNLVSDVAQGVTFQLTGTTPNGGAPTTVTVATNPSGLQAKLQGVLDAYNGVANALNGQLVYKGSKMGTNTLFGDPDLQSLQLRMGRLLNSQYGDGQKNTSAGDLGVQIQKDGTVTLDASKFATTIASDPDALKRFLTGAGNNGLANALDQMGNDYTLPVDGIFSAKSTGLNDVMKNYNDQIQHIDDNANSLHDRLQQQFAQLDQTMSALQSQMTYINSLFYSGSSSSSTGK